MQKVTDQKQWYLQLKFTQVRMIHFSSLFVQEKFIQLIHAFCFDAKLMFLCYIDHLYFVLPFYIFRSNYIPGQVVPDPKILLAWFPASASARKNCHPQVSWITIIVASVLFARSRRLWNLLLWKINQKHTSVLLTPISCDGIGWISISPPSPHTNTHQLCAMPPLIYTAAIICAMVMAHNPNWLYSLCGFHTL